MSHCPGSNCSKKYLCQKHFNDGDLVDFSTYGSGNAGTDENGKPFKRKLKALRARTV